MNISFKFDPEVHIGADILSKAGTIAKRHGKRMITVVDHSLDAQLSNRLREILEDSGLEDIIFDGIEEDSTPEMADNIAELACGAHCDAVIAFGGQKTQLIARMAAIMAPMRIKAFELLDAKPYFNRCLPLLSIPTEGTSAFSFTEYFLAEDPRNKQIKLIDSPGHLYSAVVVDTALLKSTLGANAVSFVINNLLSASEAYCSSKSNFLSEIMLERALGFLGKLLRTSGGGLNMEAFAQAAFLASFGASVSSPGIGTALLAAITARYPAAKAQCSAALFPVIAERLISARPEKMARIASFLGAGKAASVTDAANTAADAIRRSIEACNLPLNLKSFNITLDRLAAAAETARKLEFTASSPWTVSEEAVFGILKEII